MYICFSRERITVSPEHEATIADLLKQSNEAVLGGDPERARSALEQARKLDPIVVELEIARRAWKNTAGPEIEVQRRRESVVKRLGGVAVAAPDRIEIWRTLAEYLRQLDNHEGVLRATASGLKRDPVNIELWIRRVRAQIELERLESAARSLRHLVQFAPTHDAVEAMVRVHSICANCGALFPRAGMDTCTSCGADGPGRGAPVRSVRARHQSKFDIYFPRVRDVIAESLNMPEHIKKRLTLDTLLKRHLKRTNQQCARALRAMTQEFGSAFDEPLFNAAVAGYLDILVADLIRAINPRTDKTIDTDIRRRAIYGTEA
jgi:hypothetical protein